MTLRHHPQANLRGSQTFVVWSLLTVFFVFIFSSSVFASTISEGYESEEAYEPGTLVALSSVSPPTVTLASLINNGFLVGVVEDSDNSLLALDSTKADLSVALEGDVLAYVSDVNGDIEAGDLVGTSWIAGVGMKANNATDQRLLGIALEKFNERNENSTLVGGIDTPSGTTTATVGSIAVRLFDRDVGPEVSEVGALENIASRIAGKDVPLSRAILAVGLFTVTVVIAGVFLATAIKGSFISLGRNPLAGGSIFASLMQVSGVSIGLFLFGSVLAYIILVL